MINYSVNNKFKKIIVFGSTGYLGNSIVNGLKELCEVISSSRRNNGNHFISENSCQIIPRDIDACIFAIGSTELDSSSVFSSVQSSLSTFSLFLDRHKKDTPHAPIIYISTFQIYGSYEGKIDESTVPNPKNIYSLVHKQAEDLLKIYALENKSKFIIVRPTNIFGSFQGEFPFRRSTLVPNCFVEEALKNKSITIKAANSVFRDFVHIKDVVSFMKYLLSDYSWDQKLDTVNLCSGKSLDIFYPAESYHQDYADKNPNDRYVRGILEPKMKKLGLTQ